jgi:hypothetical protein
MGVPSHRLVLTLIVAVVVMAMIIQGQQVDALAGIKHPHVGIGGPQPPNPGLFEGHAGADKKVGP